MPPFKGKSVDWYGHFKDALKYPDTRSADIRQKYKILLEFLDNTLIPIPPKKNSRSLPASSLDSSGADRSRFSRYEPLPDISQQSSPDRNPSNLSRVAFTEARDGGASTAATNHSRQDSTQQQSRTEARADTHHSDNIIYEESGSDNAAAAANSEQKAAASPNAASQSTLVKSCFHRQVWTVRLAAKTCYAICTILLAFHAC